MSQYKMKIKSIAVGNKHHKEHLSLQNKETKNQNKNKNLNSKLVIKEIQIL